MFVYVFSFEYRVELAIEHYVEGKHSRLVVYNEFGVHIVGIYLELLSNCIYNATHAVRAI